MVSLEFWGCLGQVCSRFGGRFVLAFGVLVWTWLAGGLGILMSMCPAQGLGVCFEFGVLLRGLPWVMGFH